MVTVRDGGGWEGGLGVRGIAVFCCYHTDSTIIMPLIT